MKLTPIHPDVVFRPQPDAVQLKGLLGQRADASRKNRLLPHEDYYLLWPFREHCRVGWNANPPHPGITKGDWQGEFMGTYIAACTLASWNSGNPLLRAKLDNLVSEWLACQQPDGYLGTYDEGERWQSWDIWVQAHDLIGLLTYYDYTRSETAFRAALAVADRVLQDFGPGCKSLSATGPAGGMASSAIVEPMTWLFWQTGEERYLEFARWIVDVDWEKPGGPAIRSSMAAGKGVAGVANGKAAEMLICFTGMVELYRATGDESYLQPVLVAWDDIVRHQLYLTGTASTGEFFMANYLLRNDGQFAIGETCVTMTWLYLNLSLGRLTGEGRYFDMAEQTIYNHLLAAQSPDGSCWAYYVGLRDNRRYRWHTDPDCCPSRGIRALSILPQHVFAVGGDGLTVNFFEPSDATLALASGDHVRLIVEGSYPFAGAVRLTVVPERTSSFSLRLRLPGWCQRATLAVNGEGQSAVADAQGYLVCTRAWQAGDVVELTMDMPVRIVADRIGNPGRVALTRGPLVYAVDVADLPNGCLVDDVQLLLEGQDPAANVRLVEGGNSAGPRLRLRALTPRPQLGDGLWREPERYHLVANCSGDAELSDVLLVPFYEAGNREPGCVKHRLGNNHEPGSSISYQVWLPYECRP